MAMVSMKEAHRVNGRQQKLYSVEYSPAEPLKAVLVWHHGLAEHIGRYNYVFTKIAQAGIAVHAQDAHGHGRSEPSKKNDRAYIKKFTNLVDDFEAFASEVRAKYDPAIPFFVGGHSMGGLVVCFAVLRDQAVWRGMLLSSALIDVEWTPVLRAQSKLGNLLAAAMPRAQIVPAVNPDHLSQDPQVVKGYIEDPLILVGKVRARTSNELLKAFRMLSVREAEIALPIYAHHGTEDHITNIKAVKRLMHNAASDDASFKEITGGYHELLLGPEKDEVTQAMIDWMLPRAAPESKL